VKRARVSLRLTGRQIINISLASWIATLAVLIVLRQVGRSAGVLGQLPPGYWAAGMAVPAFDLLLGLAVLRATRRVFLARFPLLSSIVLALFVGYTLWSAR
jgi:hypothetical protein